MIAKIKFLGVLALMLLGCSAMGQNPNLLEDENFYNPYFNVNQDPNSFPGVATQYTYTNDNNGLAGDQGAGKLSIKSNPKSCSYNQFFPQTNGNRCLVVNGYGSSDATGYGTGDPSNKYVIRYTVENLFPNVLYQFSFKATHVSPAVQYNFDVGVRFRVQCNGSNVTYDNNQLTWQPTYVANQINWCESPVYNCWSDANGRVVVSIYDDYSRSPGLGDDFAIDDVSLRMSNAYTLTANNFDVGDKCLCESPTVEIPFEGHYSCQGPNNSYLLPVFYLKDKTSNQYIQPTADNRARTNHGYAWLFGDKVRYQPDEGYYGTDVINYKAEKYGMESTASITLSVGDLPELASVENWPEDTVVCINDIASFNPQANWNDNGYEVTVNTWWWKESPEDNWVTTQPFNPTEPKNYYIGFVGYNHCNEVTVCNEGAPTIVQRLIKVCDVPVITNNNALPASICAGATPPDVYVNWNNNTPNGGWYYKHAGGNYVPLNNLQELVDGDRIRFRALSACGTVESKEIMITAGPSFTTAVNNPFDSEYCPNSSIPKPQIPASWYNTSGLSGVTPGWYWVSYDGNGNANYSLISSNTITIGSENRLITCALQSECGLSPFDPPFELRVFETPSINNLDLLPDAFDTVCANTSLNDLLPALAPAGHYGDYGWEISASTTPANFSTTLPETLSLADDGRWVRFFVDPLCDAHEGVTSDPVQIAVGDKPSLNVYSLTPAGPVCAGQSPYDLFDVHVASDNHFETTAAWQVYYQNSWVPFETFDIAYNGCQVRFVATNSCGESDPCVLGAVQVTQGPEFTNAFSYEQYIESSYCVEAFPLPLESLLPGDFESHGVADLSASWEWSADGVEYHTFENDILNLPEGEYMVRCVLHSDFCGGDIPYANTFPVTVIAQPEIQSLVIHQTELCEGRVFDEENIEMLLDLHHGTVTQRQWYYARVDDMDNPQVFDPFGDPLPAGELRIRCVIENECGDTSSDWYPITVLGAPHIMVSEDWSDELELCEGKSLLEALGLLDESITINGYVEEDLGWQCYSPAGEIVDLPNIATPAYHGYTLRRSVKGCGYHEDHKDLTLVVNTVPDITTVDVGSLPNLLCEGATLDVYMPSDLVFKWTRNGDIFNVGPDGNPFSVGTYEIRYQVRNDCGWSEFSAPETITVTPGPTFTMPQSWQQPLEICEGESVGAESVPDATTLVHGMNEEDSVLGWFLRSADLSETIPWNLQDPVPSSYDGYRLVFAVKTSCQDMPLYSPGKPIVILVAPEITGDVLAINPLFCDGDQPVIPNLEMSVHPNDQVRQYWQIKLPDASRWGPLPEAWDREVHNGAMIRFVVESTKCPGNPAVSDPIEIAVNAEPEVDPIAESLQLCAQGVMSAAPTVEWNQPISGFAYWQVSADGNSGWSTSIEGYEFDPQQVDDYFQGKYVRYFVEGFCGNTVSNVAQLSLLQSAVVEIQGQESVSVSNSYWPGVYYYYTDVEQPLNWSLEPEIWMVHDTIIDGKSCCKVVVNTMGSAVLSAQVGDGSCGSDAIRLNAVQFAVDDVERVPVTIYPNPARHTVTIESEAITRVQVFNMLGQPLKTVEGHGDNKLSFNIDSLSEALYIVEIKTLNGTARKTLTITR